MITIAVYGTLRKGFFNHSRYLADAKFISDGYIRDGYNLVVDGLPFLIPHPNGEGCVVEVYEVTPEQLDRIDALEGHPYAYQRMPVNVMTDMGDEIIAQAYTYPAYWRLNEREPIWDFSDYMEELTKI